MALRAIHTVSPDALKERFKDALKAMCMDIPVEALKEMCMEKPEEALKAMCMTSQMTHSNTQSMRHSMQDPLCGRESSGEQRLHTVELIIEGTYIKSAKGQETNSCL